MSVRRLFVPLLFVLAFALRCYHLTAPLLDTHSWRQADTAAIARNFVASHFWLSHPQVDWGGATPGYVESEFPLYTGMLATLFALFGPHEWLGRLLTALFAAAAPVALYGLIRAQNPDDLTTERAARYAGLALCILPFPIYFGRTVMPDSLMLLLAIGAIWSFQRWLVQPSHGRWALALVCGALAPLAKTPNLLILFVPLAYLMIAYRGWRRIVPLTIYVLAVGLPVLLWTRHAATLPLDPRLSFGIGEKLLDRALLADPHFYALIGRWALNDILTAVGALACVLGLVVWGHKTAFSACWLPHAWLLGVVVFVLFGAAGVVGQDYYMLPLAAPGAWLIGAGLAWLHERVAMRVRPVLAVAAPLAALLLIAVLSIGRIAPMYQLNEFYGLLGQRLNLALPSGQRVGVIAPAVSEILYYGERKGWRLDPGVLVPGGLSSLGPDLGVRYVLVTDPWLSEQRELLTTELAHYRRIPVGPYALLLDLAQPGYNEPFELSWETGHVVREPFLSFWDAQGGRDALGLPISDALEQDGTERQYFERAVLARAANGTVQFSPAGSELVAALGRSAASSEVDPAFAAAFARFGGEALLGKPISAVAEERGLRVQYFERGALEQQADGTVQLGAIGRWLLEARGPSEEQQIEQSAAEVLKQ